jgi:hypothetical protein
MATRRLRRRYTRGMSEAAGTDGAYYRIRIRGRLDPSWFGGLDVTHGVTGGEATTLIAGVLPDQAALHGVLQRIGSLGLTLLSLERLPSFWEGDEPPDRALP